MSRGKAPASPPASERTSRGLPVAAGPVVCLKKRQNLQVEKRAAQPDPRLVEADGPEASYAKGDTRLFRERQKKKKKKALKGLQDSLLALLEI